MVFTMQKMRKCLNYRYFRIGDQMVDGFFEKSGLIGYYDRLELNRSDYIPHSLMPISVSKQLFLHSRVNSIPQNKRFISFHYHYKSYSNTTILYLHSLFYKKMLHNLWKCLFCLDEFNNFVAFPRRYHRRHDVSCHSDVRQQRLMPIGEGMGTRHIEGVYLTLCSWLSETSQTLDTVNEPSNGRCLRVWLYHGQWSIVPMCIFCI